ncbi:MAG TPA: hypothetical protein VF764_09015 [Steroidobacteraceae bacterium]
MNPRHEENTMAALSPEVSFRLTVTSRELVVLCKLLGDRQLTDTERQQAIELGDNLTRLRAQALKEFVNTAERLEAAVAGDIPAAKGVRTPGQPANTGPLPGKGAWREQV